MNEKIVIIGVGEIGCALGRILEKNGQEVKYWDKNQSLLADLPGGEDSLPKIVAEAGFVFLCVPSVAVREALLYINPYFNEKTIIVSLAKGMEDKTLKTMDAVIKMLLPKGQEFAILGGPMIAEELAAGKIGKAVVAAARLVTQDKVAELFADSQVVCEKTTDVKGVAVCGMMKNIYALGAGILSGLDWGDNAKGIFVTDVMGEMMEIGKRLKIKSETITSAAGLGDFITTGFSAYSANNRCGLEMAEGSQIKCTSEGYHSVVSFTTMLGEKYREFKILAAIHEVVVDQKDPCLAFKDVMI